MPQVSVLMPVLNGGPFLRAAIESVLAQTHGDLELLVVDDGSSDGSPELAESVGDARVIVIRNERRAGLSAALNLALRRARGELVARLDADDVARPERIARQVEFLRRHPEAALVGSQANLVDETGAGIGTVQRPCDEIAIRWYQQLDNAFIHSAVMFRKREILDGVGGYDESLRLCEDWDLWGRVLARHGAANLDEPLVDYRFSLASITGAIESSAAHPRRPLLQSITRQLVVRHIAQTLGGDALPEAELTLMTGYLLGVEGAALAAFLRAFERLRRRFVARYPAAPASTDFHRTLARQFDAIAYRVTPPRRRSALRVYGAAAARGPHVLKFLPWSRALTLVALGRSGRDRLRHLRNASLARIA